MYSGKTSLAKADHTPYPATNIMVDATQKLNSFATTLQENVGRLFANNTTQQMKAPTEAQALQAVNTEITGNAEIVAVSKMEEGKALTAKSFKDLSPFLPIGHLLANYLTNKDAHIFSIACFHNKILTHAISKNPDIQRKSTYYKILLPSVLEQAQHLMQVMFSHSKISRHNHYPWNEQRRNNAQQEQRIHENYSRFLSDIGDQLTETPLVNSAKQYTHLTQALEKYLNSPDIDSELGAAFYHKNPINVKAITQINAGFADAAKEYLLKTLDDTIKALEEKIESFKASPTEETKKAVVDFKNEPDLMTSLIAFVKAKRGDCANELLAAAEKTRSTLNTLKHTVNINNNFFGRLADFADRTTYFKELKESLVLIKLDTLFKTNDISKFESVFSKKLIDWLISHKSHLTPSLNTLLESTKYREALTAQLGTSFKNKRDIVQHIKVFGELCKKIKTSTPTDTQLVDRILDTLVDALTITFKFAENQSSDFYSNKFHISDVWEAAHSIVTTAAEVDRPDVAIQVTDLLTEYLKIASDLKKLGSHHIYTKNNAIGKLARALMELGHTEQAEKYYGSYDRGDHNIFPWHSAADSKWAFACYKAGKIQKAEETLTELANVLTAYESEYNRSPNYGYRCDLAKAYYDCGLKLKAKELLLSSVDEYILTTEDHSRVFINDIIKVLENLYGFNFKEDARQAANSIVQTLQTHPMDDDIVNRLLNLALLTAENNDYKTAEDILSLLPPFDLHPLNPDENHYQIYDNFFTQNAQKIENEMFRLKVNLRIAAS